MRRGPSSVEFWILKTFSSFSKTDRHKAQSLIQVRNILKARLIFFLDIYFLDTTSIFPLLLLGHALKKMDWTRRWRLCRLQSLSTTHLQCTSADHAGSPQDHQMGEVSANSSWSAKPGCSRVGIWRTPPPPPQRRHIFVSLQNCIGSFNLFWTVR